MSSGCGDVLSLEDLKTAKKHQLFEAEVITGKQGGVAGGADIDYATNQVTGQVQKTLPAILRDAGFQPASFDFTTGGTLGVNDRDKVVYDPVSKTWYSWSGALPHVIAAGTNPVGVADWNPQTDPNLRTDLASTSTGKGASLVMMASGKTVQQELQYVNAKIIYAEDYGVKGDGATDSTTALKNLSLAVNAMTEPFIDIVLPKGVVIIGGQTQSGSTGAGYAFRPTYESFGLKGFLDISLRTGKTKISGFGTTLKMKSGMKIGSFDPVTGLPSADQVTVSPNPDYLAYPGHVVAITGLDNIEIEGLRIDGNATGMTLGGRYGDNGWQVISFGVWSAENVTVTLKKMQVVDCGTDSVYLTANSTWSPSASGVQRSVLMQDCLLENSRRQGISITGGQFIVIDRCDIQNIGRFATGAGSFYSGPEACVDIETEGATVQDVVIKDSQLINGYYTILSQVVDVNSRRCSVYNTLLRNGTPYTSVLNAMPDLKFFNCTFEGGGIASSDLASSQGSYPSLFNCLVSNNINGATVPGSRLVGKFGAIRDCVFRVQLHNQFNLPTLAITSDHTNTLTSFSNNVLSVYGDKTTAPKNAGGRVLIGTIYTMRDVDLLITDGTTGAGNCELAISDCTSGQKGVLCNTSKVTDSSGNTIALPDGKWMIPGANRMLYAQKTLPAYVGASLGDDAHRFGSIFLSAGGALHMTSANGTKYLATISDLGAWVITPGA